MEDTGRKESTQKEIQVREKGSSTFPWGQGQTRTAQSTLCLCVLILHKTHGAYPTPARNVSVLLHAPVRATGIPEVRFFSESMNMNLPFTKDIPDQLS